MTINETLKNELIDIIYLKCYDEEFKEIKGETVWELLDNNENKTTQ